MSLAQQQHTKALVFAAAAADDLKEVMQYKGECALKTERKSAAVDTLLSQH
jgi:hypothetical protein